MKIIKFKPVFINKVLLEHSYTHSFLNWLWLLSHYNGRVESLRQETVEYLLSDPLQKKFTNPCSSQLELIIAPLMYHSVYHASVLLLHCFFTWITL